ncbi:MAG: PqiC family protein [Gammaproteobacteria bacterium]
MRQTILRFAVTTGLSILFLLGACARTEPARFYMLRPLAGAELKQPSASAPIAADTVAIGIETVELAAYLDRPEIATRRGPYQIQFADFDRWAEPLNDNIAQVLTDNLSALLSSQRIHVLPQAAGVSLDYRLSVYVVRLDNVPGEEALLRVHWNLWDGNERKRLIARKVEYRESLPGQDYDSIAAANSRLLASLSSDIAEAIDDLPAVE